MRRKKTDDEVMIQYLLGGLESGQEDIERRYLNDPEYFDRLLEMESQLIDNYLLNKLSDTQRAQFETQFLSSPHRKMKVERTRAMMEAVFQSRGKAMQAISTPTARKGSFLGMVKLPVDYAACFRLQPATVRHSGTTQHLQIPSGAELIHIELQVGDAGYARYRVQLQTVEGEETWTQNNLRSYGTSSSTAVSLSLPSTAISTGHYILLLKGMTPRGDFEKLPSYSFSVTME